MIKSNTPVEEYIIGKKVVYVKRDDLCTIPPLPPLAKMRGVERRLQKLKKEGITGIGVFDTKVSIAGYGVGLLAREYGIETVTYYAKQKELSPNIKLASSVCKDIVSVRPGRTPICYVYAKRHAEANNIYMMPQGLALSETMEAVAEEASAVPSELLRGTLVICAGTGTILSGLIRGLKIMPSIYSISACISPIKQRRNIVKLLQSENLLNNSLYRMQSVNFIEPIMDYYSGCDMEMPFDSNRHYDAKAWKWLIEHLDMLKEPVLFWNIGGNYGRFFK